MQHHTQQLLLLLVPGLALALGTAGVAQAQSATLPPAGGLALHEVSVLHPVAEPGGGLIPYRQGKLWGYADSTGRVWIRPELTDEPTFFVRGLATFSLTQPIDARTSRVLGTVLLNARGECLRLGPQQVAVLRPDSTMEKKERAAVVGQRIVESVYYDWNGACWGIMRARPVVQGLSGRGASLYVQHHNTRWGERYSIHNARGKQLSKTFYTSISRFVGPWAKFEGEGIYERQQDAANGMLNRQGQEVGGRFYNVSGDYSATLAAVAQRPDGGDGLIDTTGHFVLGPSDNYSYAVPDSAGLVLRAHLGVEPGGSSRRITGYDFVHLDGSPAFPNLPLFYRPSSFGTNNQQPLGPDLALIYAPTGLGILESSGRWRVAPRYTSLGTISNYSQGLHTSFYNPSYSDNTDLDLAHTRPPELGMLLAERDGKLGMVRLRDGQEIIPTRYDRPDNYGTKGRYWPLYRGFAGFSRAGQDYLLNARGEEIAKGRYTGWDFRVRGQRYLYLDLDEKSSAENGRHWALVDTTGWPLLPPLRRQSQLLGVSPAGLLLVHYLDSAAGPRGTIAALDRQGREKLTGLGDLVTWHSLILAGTGHHTGARAEFLQLFDAAGQPLVPARLYQADTLRRARVLVGRPHPADSLLVLDGWGRRWATLPPAWQAVDWPSQPPFRWQGQLVPIEADKRKLGYLTRGGVRLWQD